MKRQILLNDEASEAKTDASARHHIDVANSPRPFITMTP